MADRTQTAGRAGCASLGDAECGSAGVSADVLGCHATTPGPVVIRRRGRVLGSPLRRRLDRFLLRLRLTARMDHLGTATVGVGIAAGLASGALNAVAFLMSRHHATARPGGGQRMLVLAHVVMGIACLPLVWLLWPPEGVPVADFLPPLAGSIACYLASQVTLLAALRRADASRVVPLLGLKIVMLALLVTFLLRAPLDTRQWFAVGLSVVAAAVLQGRRDPVPAAVVALMLATCLGFAAADLMIVRLIDAVHAAAPARSRLWASSLAVVTTYASCGLLALPFLAVMEPRRAGEWRAATWYGGVWLGGMAALYACFGLLGPVFGNVLQSSRGVLAVVFGAALAHLGWHELEQRVDRATLIRRVAAALLMTGAIAAYVIDLAG
jgi:drug/metabolite transporter (DMT)-like permease